MEGPFFKKSRAQKTESSSAWGKKTCHPRSRQRTKGETPRCVAVLSGKKWMAIFGGLFLRDMEEFHWFQYPTFVLTNGFAEILQNSGCHFCCNFPELNIGRRKKTDSKWDTLPETCSEFTDEISKWLEDDSFPFGAISAYFQEKYWFYRGYLKDYSS